ncbi:MAG: tetratricopeptide repeat protein [Mycobacterium leprae]
MATCQNCGSEMNSQYCPTCGARAQAETAASRKAAKAPKAPPSGYVSRRTRNQRNLRMVALVCFGLVLVAAGALGGSFFLNGSSIAGGLSSTSVDASGGSSDAAQPTTPIGKAQDLMDQGVSLMSSGDRAGAVAVFRKSVAQFEAVLKDEPNDLYARSYLGLTYYYAGDSTKAVSNLQQALKQDPNYLWAVFNLAWIYETGGKNAEAIAQYQHYLDVVDKEQQDQLKYAEQLELIPTQIQAAKDAIAKLQGSGSK